LEINHYKTGETGIMENLEIGNPLVDEQHRRLISVVNDLLSVRRQTRPEQIMSTFDFFRYYMVKHLFDEEGLQIHYGYPGYAAHRARHDEFKIMLRDFAVELKENGPGGNFADRVAADIGGWFMNHVLTEDAKLVHYIHNIEETRSAAEPVGLRRGIADPQGADVMRV
jgi:hemerythrin